MEIKSVDKRRKQDNALVEQLVKIVEQELDNTTGNRLDFDATGYSSTVVEKVVRLYQDAGYKAFFNTGKQWEPCYLLQIWW